MAFYGKIYEQISDVFDRIQFTNMMDQSAGSGENNIVYRFPSSLESDFIIDAASHGDKIPMLSANGWIQFVRGGDTNGNTICNIYHSKPKIAQKDTDLILKEIIPGEQYEFAISDDSTLLTQEEKEELITMRERGELLYFGDSIVISTPKYDAAGHISEHEEKTYKFGIIPHFEEFITAITDLTELQEIVGVEDYPEDADPLSARVLGLEITLEEIQDGIEQAVEKAANAESSAATAAMNSENAANSAAQAQSAAQAALDAVNSYQGNLDSKFGGLDYNISGLIGAVGATTNAGIQGEMGDILDEPTLIAWNKYLTERINSLETKLRNLGINV